MTDTPYRFFLGGHDLEMLEIGRLLRDAGLADRVCDAGLAWGARASAYAEQILAALTRGEIPVLVELEDDLPLSVGRDRVVIVDHHGEKAGADKPTSIEQIRDVIGAGHLWTRWRDLVAANDRGHAAALRALGASLEEIRNVRDADRAAQGVRPEWEADARRALANARRVGRLLVIDTTAPTSSAVADFLLPEYSGPGECDALVSNAANYAFFGDGRVIAELAQIEGCWYGGALPERGFWGAPRGVADLGELEGRVAAIVVKLDRLPSLSGAKAD